MALKSGKGEPNSISKISYGPTGKNKSAKSLGNIHYGPTGKTKGK